MPPRVYQNIELDCNHQIEFDKSAAHHLIKVLRLKNQAQVVIFNGDGYDYLTEVFINKKQISANIIKKTLSNTQSCLNITLLQGISKGDRMDIAIQKSIELGVNRIIPVICQRTVVNLKNDRAEKKMRHWRGIATHACEQSGRSTLAEIAEVIKLADVFETLDNDALKITLDPLSLKPLSTLEKSNNNFYVLIGPEGGLNTVELLQAKAAGFNGIRLGTRILRTETAALASISSIQTLWGDFKN